jgi:uncharacterized protein
MALARFLPKNERFFDYFQAAANNALETAKAFAALLENYSDVERKVRHIRDLEQAGDDIYHQISNALTQAFMTPLDRDDIVLLARSFRRFCGRGRKCGAAYVALSHGQANRARQSHGANYCKQAELLVTAIPLVESSIHSTEAIRQAMAIKRLEDEADEEMNKVLADLYDEANDIKSLVAAIRRGELFRRSRGPRSGCRQHHQSDCPQTCLAMSSSLF